jgi:hypothetical protein
MHDVTSTLVTYSRRVEALYALHADRVSTEAVSLCLRLARAKEQRLQRGLADYGRHMSDRIRSVHFKWHDRTLLFKALEGLAERQLNSIDDVVSMVVACDRALETYCSSLTASTNSVEVLDFVNQLQQLRVQESRTWVWQAIRSEHADDTAGADGSSNVTRPGTSRD